MNGKAVAVAQLTIEWESAQGAVPIVTDVSFEVGQGEALGIVGESGSGKSLTARAIFDLLPRSTRQSGGRIDLSGNRVAMVFQEPLTAMNPTMRVVDLIADGVATTRGVTRKQAIARALELMSEVGIPDVVRRAQQLPHELSGGLRQRVGIAMALSADPSVLLCDEPTTALDVTIQDQILGLLDRLRRERGLALVFITHDLAVVASLCQRIAVMYAGQIVEIGTTEQVVREPVHPYTRALMAASRREKITGDRNPIEGTAPRAGEYLQGCRFADRCPFVLEDCRTTPYRLEAWADQQATACIRAQDGELVV